MALLPIRFGLGSFLLVVALASAICALVAGHHVPFFMLFGLTVSVPSILAVVAIWGSRYQRAFCVGALGPTGVFTLGVVFSAVQKAISEGTRSWEAAWPHLSILAESWGFAIMAGGLSCFVLWAMIRNRTDDESP